MSESTNLYSVPQEIRALKPVGTMVKVIRGNYYVYEFQNVKVDGGWRTKMGNMIGKITLEDGYVKNEAILSTHEFTTKDYGQYALAVANTTETFKTIRKVFCPDDARKIYVISLIHLINSYTYAKNIKKVYDLSVLSEMYKVTVGEEAVLTLLSDLGSKQKLVFEFEQLLIDECSKEVAFDGHSVKNASRENDLAEYGNKYGLFKDKQINVLMAYDINTFKPLLSKVYPGSELDKTSIKDLMDVVKFNNMLFIVDRGFYTKENIELFSSNGNRYIIPLSMNMTLYKKATENMELNEIFLYGTKKGGRAIQYKEAVYENKRIYVYRDIQQAAADSDKYLQKVENGVSGYTIEKYNSIKDFFGTIVLETNLSETAKHVFEKYKARWRIETFYDCLKNDLDFEAWTLNDYYKTQGLSFIMLIVGLLYREFKNAANVLKGMSIDDIFYMGRDVKIHKRNNKWFTQNVKAENLTKFKAMNVEITKEIAF
jgi:hypothetical protein